MGLILGFVPGLAGCEHGWFWGWFQKVLGVVLGGSGWFWGWFWMVLRLVLGGSRAGSGAGCGAGSRWFWC